jgi:hypothetical protein
MHEVSKVSEYGMEVGRRALMQRFHSAHERLAVSEQIDEVLRATAFPDCDIKARIWAMRAHESRGANLTDDEKAQVATTLRVLECKAAIRNGEQPTLSGLRWPERGEIARDLDRRAYDAWGAARQGRPKHEPFAIFRVHWHVAQGTPDVELIAIIRWAIAETKQDDTWVDWFQSAPKATRTRMRNELLALLRQAQARFDTAKLITAKSDVRVGKPAKELGAIIAAYAKVYKTGGMRGHWGRESDHAVRELQKAIEASGAWAAYRAKAP